jgi:hypothetical protein
LFLPYLPDAGTLAPDDVAVDDLVNILKRVGGKAQLGPSPELKVDAQSLFGNLPFVSSKCDFSAVEWSDAVVPFF